MTLYVRLFQSRLPGSVCQERLETHENPECVRSEAKSSAARDVFSSSVTVKVKEI